MAFAIECPACGANSRHNLFLQCAYCKLFICTRCDPEHQAFCEHRPRTKQTRVP